MLKYANDDNFIQEIEKSSNVALVEFFATWCGACKKMEYVINELSVQKSDVDIIKVDIDKSGKLAIKYDINVVPTIVIFKDLKPVKTVEGYLEKEDIIQLINEHIN